MQGYNSGDDSTYAYEYSRAGETVRLGVQGSGVAREPRVCWQVGERSGERGHISLNAPEPLVRLEGWEIALLDGRLVAEIPVPREIGAELKAGVEKLGTVVTESNRITTDPAAFPAKIAGFDRVGWESDRNVMWYCRDERSTPRAYQIERGELVFRAQEWANGEMSKQELIDQYGLTTPWS